MSANPVDQKDGSLENQLRNMIITNPPTQEPAYPNEYRRGRSHHNALPHHHPHNRNHGHHLAQHSQPNLGRGRGYPNYQYPLPPVNNDIHTRQFHRGRGRGGYPPGAYVNNENHPANQSSWLASPPATNPNASFQPPFQVDPNAFQRGPHRGGMHGGHRGGHRGRHHGGMRDGEFKTNSPTLFQPPPLAVGPHYDAQWQYLEKLLNQELPRVEMGADEIASKDSFRLYLEQICQSIKSDDHDQNTSPVTLQSFGSLSSGFAFAGSDMDLAIVTDSLATAEQKHFSLHETSLPRLLEKALLDRGIGARLLSRTRVPIIKICQLPSKTLLDALREERSRWDRTNKKNKKWGGESTPAGGNDLGAQDDGLPAAANNSSATENAPSVGGNESGANEIADVPLVEILTDTEKQGLLPVPADLLDAPQSDANASNIRPNKQWTRERNAGPLDFPKSGVGIQCDVNFFNPLGLFNTKLLRCYSKCDPRVRPMILFVKAWAKRRKINSSYYGTLNSYGYVLMVLHYLINVARPSVLPNLQLTATALGMPATTVDGWEVRFLNDEDKITAIAANGGFTQGGNQNHDPIGVLLLGFFRYYATTHREGFVWMQDVLSLRSPGGIRRKAEKGWTGAKIEQGDNNNTVRQRYLFAIEDPFELSHNVARTVTHKGIIAIRDEFRRAWRILQAVGKGLTPNDGQLFDELDESSQDPRSRSKSPRRREADIPISRETSNDGRNADAATVKVNVRKHEAQDYARAFPTLGAQENN